MYNLDGNYIKKFPIKIKPLSIKEKTLQNFNKNLKNKYNNKQELKDDLIKLKFFYTDNGKTFILDNMYFKRNELILKSIYINNIKLNFQVWENFVPIKTPQKSQYW